MVLAADVGDPRAVRNAVGRIRRAWRRIDVLINNAGILIPGPVAEMSSTDLQAMLRVNLLGAVHTIQAVLPGMQRRNRGAIINVASLAGRRGVTPLGGYCATKFALVGLTEALRTEVDSGKIHVGLVLPGVVDTPMVHGVDQAEALPEWPAALNMPADWVVAAIMLSVRYRLHEVSVPPGAATFEIISSLVPGAADTLIGWMTAAGRLLNRAGAYVGRPAPEKATKARPSKRKARPRSR
jgi:NAD(P)-dependent dehydrogenase (short-subunit alcohol dehydrogenase family)